MDTYASQQYADAEQFDEEATQDLVDRHAGNGMQPVVEGSEASGDGDGTDDGDHVSQTPSGDQARGDRSRVEQPNEAQSPVARYRQRNAGDRRSGRQPEERPAAAAPNQDMLRMFEQFLDRLNLAAAATTQQRTEPAPPPTVRRVYTLIRTGPAPCVAVLSSFEQHWEVPHATPEPGESDEDAGRRVAALWLGLRLDLELTRIAKVRFEEGDRRVEATLMATDVPLGTVVREARCYETTKAMVTSQTHPRHREPILCSDDAEEGSVTVHHRAYAKLLDCTDVDALASGRRARGQPRKGPAAVWQAVRAGLEDSTLVELIAPGAATGGLTAAETSWHPAERTAVGRALGPIAKCNGKDDAALDAWLRKIPGEITNRGFKLDGVQAFRLMTGSFEGRLAEWWAVHCDNCKTAEEPLPTTVAGLTALIQAQVMATDIRQANFERLICIRQGDATLHKYVSEFNYCLTWWRGDLGEEFLCRLFLNGIRNLTIKAECFSRVKTAQLTTLYALQRDACAMATTHDKLPKRFLPMAAVEDGGLPSGKRRQGEERGRTKEQKTKRRRLDRQGQQRETTGGSTNNPESELQKARDQWPAAELDRIMRNKACLGCGKTGHRFKDCRKWAATKQAKHD